MTEPYVCAAPVEHSGWPDSLRVCDGGDAGCGPASWAIWTSTDTGDGYRLACTVHLGEWVESVGSRLW